jgi:hypothetical protein
MDSRLEAAAHKRWFGSPYPDNPVILKNSKKRTRWGNGSAFSGTEGWMLRKELSRLRHRLRSAGRPRVSLQARLERAF